MGEKLCAEPGCTEEATQGEFCEEHLPTLRENEPSTMVSDLKRLDQREVADLLQDATGRDGLGGLGKGDLISLLGEISDQNRKKLALNRYEGLIKQARKLAERERRERGKGVDSNARFYVDIEANPPYVTYKVLRSDSTKKKSSILGDKEKYLTAKVQTDAPPILELLIPITILIDIFIFFKTAFSSQKREKKDEFGSGEVIFREKLRVPSWVSKELGDNL